MQTPAGLMVPIVRDADRKGLAAIAGEVKELAGRVRALLLLLRLLLLIHCCRLCSCRCWPAACVLPLPLL